MMPGSTGTSALVYTAHRIARHARWARTEGVRRLVEEDRLDPRERSATALGKWRWRRAFGLPSGQSLPVYVVGLQRSGTNMLLRGLQAAPEVEVHNENDRALFSRFRLRPDEVLTSVVSKSRHQVVLVKPLCDSHRVDALLALPGARPGRAVWAYRDVDDRARSEVSKFGDSNRQALVRIARGEASEDWQAQGLGPEAVDLVRSFDCGAMSPDTAAALFWYLRNGIFFELGLDRRPDVMLSSYEALVADPEGCMEELCRFVGLSNRPEFWRHVEHRSTHHARPLDIDPRVRELCAGMADRLDRARRGATA
jgi:hypothetical protein